MHLYAYVCMYVCKNIFFCKNIFLGNPERRPWDTEALLDYSGDFKSGKTGAPPLASIAARIDVNATRMRMSEFAQGLCVCVCVCLCVCVCRYIYIHLYIGGHTRKCENSSEFVAGLTSGYLTRQQVCLRNTLGTH